MNIYVGNLAYEVTEDDLQKMFEAFGQVSSIKIIADKFSGESKGFGFVEMPNNTEAQAAINDLNGKDLKGRSLNVSEARPRPERRQEGGRRGGPRGGGRGGGPQSGGRGGGPQSGGRGGGRRRR